MEKQYKVYFINLKYKAKEGKVNALSASCLSLLHRFGCSRLSSPKLAGNNSLGRQTMVRQISAKDEQTIRETLGDPRVIADSLHRFQKTAKMVWMTIAMASWMRTKKGDY